MNSTASKLVDCYELRDNCAKFASYFSPDDSSNVGLNDLIFELSVMHLTLLNRPMSAMWIFEFVREADCYPNISIAYWILFTMTDCSIS